MTETRLKINGLAEARRDLRAVDKALPREVGAALKKAAGVVATEAQRQAPKRTGRLARSLRPAARGTRAFVRSPLPYAPVIAYGAPKRHIKANPFLERAVDRKAGEALEVLADELDTLFRREGFR